MPGSAAANHGLRGKPWTIIAAKSAGLNPDPGPARHPLRLPDRRKRFDRHHLCPSHRRGHEPGAGQPWCSIGSDGSALAIEGPLRRGHPHPRSFGTFPRVLGEYVRNRRLLRLEDAVRKMTSMNAAKAGLFDRGDPTRIVSRTSRSSMKKRDRSVHLSRAVSVQRRRRLRLGQRPGRARSRPAHGYPGRAVC